MKTTSIGARTLACALLATTAFCGLTAGPAAAQTAREHRALDSNGVDLTHGDFVMAFVEGSIGSGEAGLALVRTGVWTPAASNGHEWDGVILVQDSSSGLVNNHVYLGTTLVPFRNSDTSPDGSATLTGSGSNYVYRSADGTEIAFADPTGNSEPGSNLCNGSEGQTHCSLLPLSIASPDGKTVAIAWDTSSHCPFNGSCTYYTRIAGLSNSFGYRIAFAYAGGLNANGIPTAGWFQRTGAAFYNDLVSTTTAQASTAYAYPATGVTEVTDTGGRTWRFTGTANGVTGIRRPGASSDTTSIAYSAGSVASVTSEGVTTNYERSLSAGTATMTATLVDGDPNSADPQTLVVSDLAIGRPTLVTDPLGHDTAYQYDPGGRLTRVTAPEGNYVAYAYDGRGNLIRTEAVPKGGSGATIVTTASYEQTCSNPVTCNRPSSTTDERGNVTDYVYHPTHGGVLKVTGPAPTPGAVRPQTRYAYTLTDGEYRLTGTSACRTGAPELNGVPAACPGTADEMKSAIAHDANGNVVSSSTGSGDGALTATTAMDYDPVGNLVAVDGPLDGPADTSHIRYNAARQVVGKISPDPDGAGPLRPRAVRNIYAEGANPAAGLLTRVEPGNVANQSADMATFAPAPNAPAVEIVYENARPVIRRLVSGSTVHALTQTSYDPLGRVDCVAQRMNPAEFGSPPASACTLDVPGTGANDFGPDRIVRSVYDKAGQVVQTRTAVGTADEAAEVTATYTGNGLVQTVTDAENNKTTFEYDGHDRLLNLRYPVAAKGANASAPTSGTGAHFERFGYDAGSNVTTFRNRAGETIGYAWDALGRMTSKDRPGSEPDVTYAYDLLGRMTAAATASQTLAFAYDALGRQLSQTDGSRTYSSQHDLAGRRTRLTHPDGFFVDQDYLVTGEMTRIREYGATEEVSVLATYGYDDLGRRTSLTFANGESASYQYDPASRLALLVRDLGGSANDLTLTFAYNPAGQIVSTTRSNPGSGPGQADPYAWTGHGSGSTSTTANGLNQLAGWNGTLAYDAKGNMISDGTRSYTYDSENRLSPAPPSFPYHYDPLGRLAGAGSPLAIHYENYVDGLIAERLPGSPTLQYRHVFGPGTDEPIVWYVGSGTNDRRFLHADERGSIVAVTDSNANLLAINRYDEYGKTQTSNSSYMGRFLYTGQRYFSGSGLYYYKNRFYHPGVGRFMQPDPIGYEAGMNLYAYVGGDPVNFTDPSGLCTGTRICNPGATGSFLGVGQSGISFGGHFEQVRPIGAAQADGQDIVITSAYIWVRDSAGIDLHNFSRASSMRCRIPQLGCMSELYGEAQQGSGPIAPTADPNPDPRRDGCGNPMPPASRRYSLPPGYARYVDPLNRTVKDPTGKTVNNPYYEHAFGRGGGIKWGAVAYDLAWISARVAESVVTGGVMRRIWGESKGGAIMAGNRVVSSGGEAAHTVGGSCSR